VVKALSTAGKIGCAVGNAMATIQAGQLSYQSET
jgi:hypothetical protein